MVTDTCSQDYSETCVYTISLMGILASKCKVFLHIVVHSLYLCPVIQEGDFLVRTHHVEYCDGGILDPDDILSDLVEDKDKVRMT